MKKLIVALFVSFVLTAFGLTAAAQAASPYQDWVQGNGHGDRCTSLWYACPGHINATSNSRD